MTQTVELPLWLLALIVLFAAVTFASHFLFPSVRWFLRRRLERAVAQLNTRLTRPIAPFKLARRTDMIQRLIYDPEVTQAIVEDARARGEREDVAFERARRYAREIVPSFSATAYFGFGTRAARWLATALFDVRTTDAGLTEIDPDATVIFVMNHRSNMDYVLVTYLAARASALSYAVGEWAQIWPLSGLIKSMGAYFIRRRSRGALYRKVLARYVHMATEAGVTQAIFPEGGLSLTGEVRKPKMGLLSYVVEAARRTERDVVFVPVAIAYDRVLEDRVLLAAQARGDRRFGVRVSVVMRVILQRFWLWATGRFSRFGQAAVDFGHARHLSEYPVDITVEDLARDLMERVDAHMPVLGVPLLAHRLLQADAPVPRDALLAPAHGVTSEALSVALEHLAARAFAEAEGDLWRPCPEERAALIYYAKALPPHVIAQHSAGAKL